MMKKLVALMLISLTLTACGGESSVHVAPAPEVAAFLTIENEEPNEIDVYLDFQYVGTVLPFETASFFVEPGEYDLSIDFTDDADGPIYYTNVFLTTDTEVYVEVNSSLIGLLIDLIFE